MALLGPKFDEALAYASASHRSQKRKKTAIPYISHPLAVCGLVLEDGGSEVEAIAALLHDVAEDQGGEEAVTEIGQRFGDEVRSLVSDLSDDLPARGANKRPWRERKDEYIAHLKEAPASVIRISLADKLHNARAIALDLELHGDSVWDRFNAGADEVRWYYGALLEVFESRLPSSRNLPELRRAVAAIGPTRSLPRDAVQSRA